MSALDRDMRYGPSAIFVAQNSDLGWQLFCEKDPSGAIDELGLPNILPAPDSFDQRVNLLPDRANVCEGRALRKATVEISSCEGERLPRYIYRAVHEGHPGRGLEARGIHLVFPDALDFQIHLEEHLKPWSVCRSPFLSATSHLGWAQHICCTWLSEGRFTGIRLLQIDTRKGVWHRDKLPVWKLTELLQKFGLEQNDYREDEFLIEQRVPEDSVEEIAWN